MQFGNSDKVFIKNQSLVEIKEEINSELSARVFFKYTKDPDFDIRTSIRLIDFDKKRERDLLTNNGFFITSAIDIKRDTDTRKVSPDGIFSNRYGPRLSDLNTFIGNYKCKCGALTTKINHGLICEYCHEPVEYASDDLSYTGWMVLKNNYVIHPVLFRNIEKFLGTFKPPEYNKRTDTDKRILQMLEYKGGYNKNGIKIPYESPYPNEPYVGIGMIEFVNKFDEIMDYYLDYFRINSQSSYPNKLAQYEIIKKNREKVFTKSIPVYSLLLRPIDLSNGTMKYDDKNKLYVKMNCNVHRLNEIASDKYTLTNEKDISRILYETQTALNELNSKLLIELSVGKHSSFRKLIAGRLNMSQRAVIAQDSSLKIDQVILPYTGLVIVFQPVIVNVLMNKYGMSLTDAVNYVNIHKDEPDEAIESVLQNLIQQGKGIPIILNRNPTIGYGSILQLYCVGYTKDLSIKLSLQIIKLLAADFDGDALNDFHLLNKEFVNRIEMVFNPRNVMYISRMNGLFNKDVSMQRSQLTNVNKMIHMSRKHYTREQLQRIKEIREINKVAV